MWYHWITVYMIIIGGFCLAVIGDQLGGWFVLGCLASIVAGVVLTVVLPGKDDLAWRRQMKGR